MKHIAVLIINIYQIFFSTFLRLFVGTPNACRFSVPCSSYAKKSILSYGLLKGGYLSFKRLASCQPFNKNTY